MKNELCPTCNESMKIEKFIDEFSVSVKCNRCNKTFKITHEEKAYPANINSFNWGAFMLWRWWALINGKILLSFIGLILIPFIKISYVFYIIDLLFTISSIIFLNFISSS